MNFHLPSQADSPEHKSDQAPAPLRQLFQTAAALASQLSGKPVTVPDVFNVTRHAQFFLARGPLIYLLCNDLGLKPVEIARYFDPKPNISLVYRICSKMEDAVGNSRATPDDKYKSVYDALKALHYQSEAGSVPAIKPGDSWRAGKKAVPRIRKSQRVVPSDAADEISYGDSYDAKARLAQLPLVAANLMLKKRLVNLHIETAEQLHDCIKEFNLPQAGLWAVLTGQVSDEPGWSDTIYKAAIAAAVGRSANAFFEAAPGACRQPVAKVISFEAF